MSQPKQPQSSSLSYQGVRVREVYKLLDSFRALDRSVVEISMHMYNIPRHDQVAMLQQHRRLHAAIREHLPRFLE